MSCTSPSDDEDDQPSVRKKMSKDSLYQKFLDGDPAVGPLGKNGGRYQYIISYGTPKPTKNNVSPENRQPPPVPPLKKYVVSLFTNPFGNGSRKILTA